MPPQKRCEMFCLKDPNHKTGHDQVDDQLAALQDIAAGRILTLPSAAIPPRCQGCQKPCTNHSTDVLLSKEARKKMFGYDDIAD